MPSDALLLHARHRGKIEVRSLVPLENRADLSLAYTPGVAEVCRAIVDGRPVGEVTLKSRTVAVISDGSAVLGLGNIGALAAIPVMEGKCVLFKQIANIDAFPICLSTQNADEIVATIRSIAPVFGGINLEDIAAPRCFEIERRLQDLGIPVFHDDQHGTAIVVLAALLNASKVTKKDFSSLRIVINGAGAAGTAIARLLMCADNDQQVCQPVGEVVVCDSKGIVSRDRADLDFFKRELAQLSNPRDVRGSLAHALQGADVFIGVSKGNLVSKEMIASMNSGPLVFALANPIPEISAMDARAAGASLVGTGRSDDVNQINNVLAFPGVFAGALKSRAPRITSAMKLSAATALASTIPIPSVDRFLPSPLDFAVARTVAAAVEKAAKREFSL